MGIDSYLYKIIITGIVLFCSFPSFASGKTYKEDSEINEIEPVQAADLDDLQKYNLKIASELIRAIDQKRLLAPADVEIQLNQLSVNGEAILSEIKSDSTGQVIIIKHRTFASNELLDLLYSLVNAPEINPERPVSILSLFRVGGAHGEIQKNGDLIGRAVDIDNFAGFEINIENPGAALAGILKLIKNFPPLRFSLGLPRPGGDSKTDPEKDYFLPVNKLKQSGVSPTGNIQGDIKEIINPEAQKKIKEAVENMKGKILFLYPDSINHLHIKTVEKNKNQ